MIHGGLVNFREKTAQKNNFACCASASPLPSFQAGALEKLKVLSFFFMPMHVLIPSIRKFVTNRINVINNLKEDYSFQGSNPRIQKAWCFILDFRFVLALFALRN